MALGVVALNPIFVFSMSNFLDTVVEKVAAEPDFEELMSAGISDGALDLLVEDAYLGLMRIDDEGGRKMKLCLILFIIGSSEKVLKELKSVPFLKAVN